MIRRSERSIREHAPDAKLLRVPAEDLPLKTAASTPRSDAGVVHRR